MEKLDSDITHIFPQIIRDVFGKGFSEETGAYIYSILCGSDLVLKDETRLHASWRGTGGVISEARGEGDYLDYYLSALESHNHPQSNALRKKLLKHPLVDRIESCPRSEKDELHYPIETPNPLHPTGWNQIVIWHSEKE